MDMILLNGGGCLLQGLTYSGLTGCIFSTGNHSIFLSCYCILYELKRISFDV